VPETELDRRLRAALRQPAEPEASPERLASLRDALPARRARRQLVAGAAATVAALGVVLGVLVPGPGGAPPRLASPHGALSGPSCVEIVAGTAAPQCAGQVEPLAAAAAPAEGTLRAAPSAAPAPVAAPAGTAVVVSLPLLPGVTWTTVDVTVGTGSTGSATRSVAVHADRNGRSVADLGRLSPGSYSLAATAGRRCSGAPACANGPVGWSAALTVN